MSCSWQCPSLPGLKFPFFFHFYAHHRDLPSFPTRRSSDLLIMSGRVSIKMAPVLRRIYDQMLEPKYAIAMRSEEHTSELQSRFDLVCRLLLEKKKRRRMNR